MHSKCISCDYTLCSSCLGMQKPGEDIADKEALCPECGMAFGDGPVLVPTLFKGYTTGEDDSDAADSQEPFDYVKDIKTWSGFLIFIAIFNTGFAIFGLYSRWQELTAEERFGLNCVIECISLIGIAIIVSAIVTLLQDKPWPGFYIVFGLYLLLSSLPYLFFGACITWLGIFGIILALNLFVNWYRYRKVRYKVRRF